jgi:hypothetical protein
MSRKLWATTAVAASLIGLAAGTSVQTADPEPQQQASLPSAQNAPPLPLGHGDIREVQNQLISLGYNPGPADGELGPATLTAAQQYDQSHGGNGQVSVDGAFLARLKADTGTRLSYEQVQERSRQQASSAGSSSNGGGGAGGAAFGNIVSQIAPIVGAAIANSNANNYGPGYYGNGNYYGLPPGYYRGYYGYGGF